MQTFVASSSLLIGEASPWAWWTRVEQGLSLCLFLWWIPRGGLWAWVQARQRRLDGVLTIGEVWQLALEPRPLIQIGQSACLGHREMIGRGLLVNDLGIHSRSGYALYDNQLSTP